MSMLSSTLARSQTHLAATVSRRLEAPLHREVRSRARREGSDNRPKQGKLDRQQQELQDLLIDPAYDPLLDGIDENYDFAPDQDPFRAPSRRTRVGRPVGSARTKPKTGADLAPGSFSHQLNREDTFSEEDEDEDEIERVIKEEDDGVPDAYELQLRFMREAYLQECQDYCIDLHHKHRATEISPYAQAQALAGIMEAIETEDETAEDSDRLPSWMRAKAILNHNWHLMEELAGNRRETIKSLQQFAYVTPERELLLDTFDESIYEGIKDPEEQASSYLDTLLLLSPTEDTQLSKAAPSPEEKEEWDGALPDFFPEEEQQQQQEAWRDLVPDSGLSEEDSRTKKGASGTLVEEQQDMQKPWEDFLPSELDDDPDGAGGDDSKWKE